MLPESLGLRSSWNAAGELKRSTLFINRGAEFPLVRTCIVWSRGFIGLLTGVKWDDF